MDIVRDDALDAMAVDPMARVGRRLAKMIETDAQLRALMPIESVDQAIKKPGLPIPKLVATLLAGYAERPAFGSRAYDIVRDGSSRRQTRRYLPAYKTITYDEVRQKTEALANAWRHHPRHGLKADEFVCTFGYTSAELTIVDLAVTYTGAVLTPLQANMQTADAMEIFADTGPPMLVTTLENLETATGHALAQESVRSLLVIDFDPRDDDERDRLAAAARKLSQGGGRVELITLEDLLVFGREFNWTPAPDSPIGMEKLAALIYTSGSTGTPKGAIITERSAVIAWNGVLKPQPAVVLSYAPMNHLMGRHAVFGGLAQGGTVYFTLRSDLSTLFEDIRLARPTSIWMLPRVAELAYQHYLSEVLRRSAQQGNLEEVREQVRNEMRYSFLGDRILIGVIGSAPTPIEVQDFLRECFDMLLIEGYGQTESGGPLVAAHRINRAYITDYKLRDVPELGYFSTDKPYPRGELLFKSTAAIPGYYKRPEATAALIDAEGFLATGDVVEERGPDHVIWIDRRNNVLKLSQGEFVPIGPLESVFTNNSNLIRQIYLYGVSHRAYLLAVVVPEMDNVTEFFGRVPELAELRHVIRTALQDAGRIANLKNFEVPRDFIIELEPFSLENGLLSSVQKLLRPKVKQKYGPRLDALYQQIEDKREHELSMLYAGPEMPVLERIGAALRVSLGLEEIDLSKDRSWRDLGGDSLGALSFSLLLEDIFGIPVPVSAILHPAGSAKRLARLVETAQRKQLAGEAASSADIHGKEARILYARDLKLERFIDSPTLDGAAGLPSAGLSNTILLTGASGYLGRFLCLEWMQCVSTTKGKIICIIRASDNVTARQRLDEAFSTLDPILAERFRALAAKHLEILAGDLTEPNFGLAEPVYKMLAETVDHIVHPAALVNHMLPYEALFEPNVVGTAELIRLALTGRQKRFDYISSVAVAYLGATTQARGEAADIRLAVPEVVLSDSYAAGYGASKWAGEVLLREAHERFHLPVNAFRADMILAHSLYHGQINVPDIFTRLLYSVVLTGLVPGSFYAFDKDEQRATAHYDGLPVDFIAGAMVEIGAQSRPDYRTFNIINAHDDDGISLDRIVDWVETAGYSLNRIEDHAQWLQRFEAKLRALPEAQRQQSSLPVLGAFAKPEPPQMSVIPSAEFVAAVRNLKVGPEVPHLSEAFIHKCLSDMEKLGMIPAPSAPPRRMASVN